MVGRAREACFIIVSDVGMHRVDTYMRDGKNLVTTVTAIFKTLIPQGK